MNLHVCVRDFRHGCQPKENNKQGDEAGDSEVDPLDILQALLRVDGLGKKHARRQERGDHGGNTLNSLGEVESNLRISRGTADGEEPRKMQQKSAVCCV